MPTLDITVKEQFDAMEEVMASQQKQIGELQVVNLILIKKLQTQAEPPTGIQELPAESPNGVSVEVGKSVS